MLFEILGIENVDYTSRKTGRPVKGTNLHCIFSRDGVSGNCVERLYVKESIDCSMFSVGDHIEVYYNRFGSVDSVVPA